MAIKITKWKPDTCDCVIEYSWDDSIAAEDREHNLHNIVDSCEDHSDVTDEELFQSVVEENSLKNEAVNMIVDNFPSQTKDILDSDGNPIGKKIMQSATPETEVVLADDGENRIVNISPPRMSDDEKAQYQEILDNKFGSGKVKVI